MCRICLSCDNSKENPLVSTCVCKGSMKFVHVNCLKVWLGFKLTTKILTNLTSYLWKSFDCEICKHSYPCTLIKN